MIKINRTKDTIDNVENNVYDYVSNNVQINVNFDVWDIFCFENHVSDNVEFNIFEYIYNWKKSKFRPGI